MTNKETLEEAAVKYAEEENSCYTNDYYGFINGAKSDAAKDYWFKQFQQEQDKNKYSEEEVIDLIQFLSMNKDFNGYGSVSKETAKYFLEQFKKK